MSQLSVVVYRDGPCYLLQFPVSLLTLERFTGLLYYLLLFGTLLGSFVG
jgi:hypothetical protein